jgi:hypothetical protein
MANGEREEKKGKQAYTSERGGKRKSGESYNHGRQEDPARPWLFCVVVYIFRRYLPPTS